jgi:hypothetical protein
MMASTRRKVYWYLAGTGKPLDTTRHRLDLSISFLPDYPATFQDAHPLEA